MFHHTIGITSMEIKLFTNKYRINQAVQILDTSHIIIIMDILHVVYKIFDFSIHLFQLQSIAISKDLQAFFNKYLNNFIEFWSCSSNENCHLHVLVDKETKKFNLIPLYPCKAL